MSAAASSDWLRDTLLFFSITCYMYSCVVLVPFSQDPVCSPKGYLFSREAILENLLEQKKVS